MSAKVANQGVGRAFLELVPLVNPETGDAIPNFPGTPDDVGRLPVGEADRLLVELGLPGGGRLEEKRDRIRLCIGLKLAAA